MLRRDRFCLGPSRPSVASDAGRRAMRFARARSNVDANGGGGGEI